MISLAKSIIVRNQYCHQTEMLDFFNLSWLYRKLILFMLFNNLELSVIMLYQYVQE